MVNYFRSSMLGARHVFFAMLGLFAGFVLLRIPFKAVYPVNWDAVQLVLGTQSFDLHHHQPHPPGYIGFVTLGRLLNPMTNDPVLSLTIISIFAGALAPVLLYLHARIYLKNGYALLTALLFGLSPLVWYYSAVALTYAAELGAGMAFLLVAHRSIRRMSLGDLLLATALLSVVGSLRQSAMLLLIPVWLYCLWQFGWRNRIQAAGMQVFVSAIWAVPLLWLSGGPSAYLRESRALADLIGGQTSILSLNGAGLQMNAVFVTAGLLVGVHLGLIVIGAAFAAGCSPLRRLTRQDHIFYACWCLPALFTFLLGHTGQLGYVLLLLPPLFLLLGFCIDDLATMAGSALRRLAIPGIVGVTVASVLIFALLPGIAYDWARPADGEPETRMSRHLLQYDLRASDEYWANLVELAGRYDPEHTVVLTTIGGPQASGSFRHASYLLPEYRVYGFGRDISGNFGHLFLAHNGHSDYSVEGLEHAQPWLRIDRQARWIIIPDREILAWIDPDVDLRLVTLENGSEVAVGYVRPLSAIIFEQQ